MTRNERTRAALYSVIGVGAAAIILATVWLVVHTSILISEIRVEQEAIQAAIAQTERIAVAVEDCTTPGGECYEQRSSDVVTIRAATIAANYCASLTDSTLRDVRECVEAILRRDAPPAP